jgi:tRNA(Ile)-lysidine synthase
VPGQRLLVAVSGGVDSMVLLRVLHDLAPEEGWQLAIAHLNHALRGRSSDADERLVRRTAESLKLAVCVERADVRRFAGTHGLSLEMAARKLRHEFLARTASRFGIRTIALAHQADDQVELFFLRLFRGSSGEGLVGMRWRNPSPSDRKIELVRPLLGQPRAALLEYAASARITFREDASNACLDIQRNLIRRELLPLLRSKYQPALSKIILRTADILGAEADFIGEVAMAWLSRRRVGTSSERKRGAQRTATRPDFIRFSTPFERLPIAVQRRVIQVQLLRQRIVGDYSLIEELRTSANKPVTIGPLGRTTSGGLGASTLAGHHLEGRGDVMRPRCFAAVRDGRGIVHLQAPTTPTFNSDSTRISLTGGAGKAEFAGARIEWQLCPFNGLPRPKTRKGAESFDADKVGSWIVLRHWQAGDRFQPIGMSKPIKLQDFFTNLKVPPTQRRELIVAATARGEVFWVENMRISERFKLSKGTTRRLQWLWKRP